MALIGCPECNKRISESAIGCTHCGYMLTRDDVAAQKMEQARVHTRSRSRQRRPNRESNFYKGIAIFACVIILGPLIIAALVNGVDTSGFQHTSSAPSPREREIRRISDTYGIDINEVRAAAHRVDGRGYSD
jgi:hypothetical protein